MEIFDELIFEFLRQAIILEYGIVSCVYEYVLRIERLNVNSRVTRIEFQRRIKVERLLNFFLMVKI